MKLTNLMPAANGATNGATATFYLPIGLSYETLFLIFSTITVAQISTLRIIANGKPIREFRTGTELNDLNVIEGRATQTALLAIDLIRFGMRTREGEEYTKLGTGRPVDLRPQLADGRPNPGYNPFPVQTLSLEFLCNGATPTAMSLFALQSEAAPTGIIRKTRGFNYTAAITQPEIADLPKGDILNWIAFASVNVTRLAIKRDNVTIFDRTDALNDLIQTDGIRTPSPSWFMMDTTENGNASEGIVTAGVNDLRFLPTLSTIGSLNMVVDMLGQLEK